MKNCGRLGQLLQRPKPGGSWPVWALTLRCRTGPHRSSQEAGECVCPWPGGLPTSPLSQPKPPGPFCPFFQGQQGGGSRLTCLSLPVCVVRPQVFFRHFSPLLVYILADVPHRKFSKERLGSVCGLRLHLPEAFLGFSEQGPSSL